MRSQVRIMDFKTVRYIELIEKENKQLKKELFKQKDTNNILSHFTNKFKFMALSKTFKIVLALCIITVLFFLFFPSTNADRTIKYKSYVIKEGDTYWSIANDLQKEIDCDIREIVFTLQKNNNIQAENLKVGDVVLIPNLSEGR